MSMSATRKLQVDPWRHRLRRLLWATFAFAIVTCYSAQVAHLYKDGHGARQCERCQGDLHAASEPVALPRAASQPPLTQSGHPSPSRLISYLPRPQDLRARSRAPPSLVS